MHRQSNVIQFEPMLTAAEVAAWLRIPTKSVYDLVYQGRLWPVRIGKRLRFPRSEVERFLRERGWQHRRVDIDRHES